MRNGKPTPNAADAGSSTNSSPESPRHRHVDGERRFGDLVQRHDRPVEPPRCPLHVAVRTGTKGIAEGIAAIADDALGRRRLHVCDPRDGVAGDVRVADLGQVGWRSAFVITFAYSGMTLPVSPSKRRYPFCTLTGSKLASRSRGTRKRCRSPSSPSWDTNHSASSPTRELLRVLRVAEMIGHLDLRPGLQHPGARAVNKRLSPITRRRHWQCVADYQLALPHHLASVVSNLAL